MSIPEPGETTGYERYLNLDEREALSREPLMRRGHAVLATAQLLETLGIDSETTGVVIETLRSRLETMSPDSTQAVGQHAIILATLLQPEEHDSTPTQAVAKKRRQGEIREIQGVPVTALDIFAGVLSPADLVTYNGLKIHQMQWLFERLRPLVEQQPDDEAQLAQSGHLLETLELLMYGSNKKMVGESVGISEDEVSRAMLDLRDLLSKNSNAAQIREDVQTASRLAQDPVVTLPAAPEVPQPTVNTPAERRATGSDKPVPAYGNLRISFREMLDDTELRALIELAPTQQAMFLKELEEIIRDNSSKPKFASAHIERLQHILSGKSCREIAQLLNTTEGNVYQAARGLNNILAKTRDKIHDIFATAMTSEADVDSIDIPPTIVVEDTPPAPAAPTIPAVPEVVRVDPKLALIEQFQTLFSDDPRYSKVLSGLLDMNRSQASNREIEQEIARLINERIDAQNIDFEALFEERGELVVVRSFIGRFVQAGRTQNVMQRPPRSLREIAQTIRPAQATTHLFGGLSRLFAAFDTVPVPEDIHQQDIPNPEDQQPLGELIENACWTIGPTLGFSNEQTLALLHRLRDRKTEVTGDLMTANMAILRAAKALNGKLSENDSRLLVAYLAPRVGQPPLSLEEIARDFSDLFDKDEDELKRKIAELYVEVGGQA